MQPLRRRQREARRRAAGAKLGNRTPCPLYTGGIVRSPIFFYEPAFFARGPAGAAGGDVLDDGRPSDRETPGLSGRDSSGGSYASRLGVFVGGGQHAPGTRWEAKLKLLATTTRQGAARSALPGGRSAYDCPDLTTPDLRDYLSPPAQIRVQPLTWLARGHVPVLSLNATTVAKTAMLNIGLVSI